MPPVMVQEQEDLIDFNIIEEQKENIEALPSGRSVKALAQLYSPVNGVASPSDTQDLNAAVRRDYEHEIAAIDESDDPLDVYDRYVRWTLDAYPSASATPQSQLLPLLERATKAFQNSPQYKNDARYLKMWLNYIRLFSEAPREHFAYLARHDIGGGLALYYEEFAAWLERAGRHNQAEEIYKMGIEREAQPIERLMRKFAEFESRASNRANDVQQPSSPALPTVRAALVTKMDPFSMTSPQPADPQAAHRNAAPSGNTRKQKMRIFSDDGEDVAKPVTGDRGAGWNSIGNLAERRKENVKSAQPWAEEKMGKDLRANAAGPKMAIFKDQFHENPSNTSNHQSSSQSVRPTRIINPRSGRIEAVFVNLELIYPNPEVPSEEYCFEELRATSRGWARREWRSDEKQVKSGQRRQRPLMVSSESTTTLIPLAGGDTSDDERMAKGLSNDMDLGNQNKSTDHAAQHEKDATKRFRKEERANKTRKIKLRPGKAETQTVQTNLDSPKGPRLIRKRSSEATMTLHTKAATDEVYELFNQPIDDVVEEHSDDVESEEDSDDDTYTSAGESTGTGRISGTASEIGEEVDGEGEESRSEPGDIEDAESTRDDTNWSEFTASKHLPRHHGGNDEELDPDDSQDMDADRPFPDTQRTVADDALDEPEEVVTPTSPHMPFSRPEPKSDDPSDQDYQFPRRPYRNSSQVAANRLPFMTPIVERTESSFGTMTKQDKDYFSSKTPCPKADSNTPNMPIDMLDEVWSSPFQDVLKETSRHNVQLASPISHAKKTKPPASAVPNAPLVVFKKEAEKVRGPVIHDSQCNPMSAEVHEAIMGVAQPPLSSYGGFIEHDVVCNRKAEIQKFCKSIAKNGKNTSDKTSTLTTPPVLSFKGVQRQYIIKKELGVGAYAPVFLAEQLLELEEVAQEQNEVPAIMGRGKFSIPRRHLEAIKMEHPPSAWEFFMLRAAHWRLGMSRPAQSIVQAYEMHLFKDEGYLVEEFRDQGTLLDLVNIVSDQNRVSGGHGGMDEVLAMFFCVEILRTVEALHSKDIIHGDLKADNVLVRFESTEDDATEHSSPYRRDGLDGWSGKGITLIDFGRAIDMRAFTPTVQFIADWPTTETDCAEMRELRPWTYQADYHGIAAIAHTMLFGRYIETVVDKGSGAGIVAGGAKNYRLREGLKRYWQTEIWQHFFSLLLNPGRHVDAEEDRRMPASRGMRAIREKMEAWLEDNSEKGSAGLRNTIRRLESAVGSRKKG